MGSMETQTLQVTIRQLTANRQSEEARALYIKLAQFAHMRVQKRVKTYYSDLVSGPEKEEIVGDVIYQLMSGSLARFRGDTLPALLAFVRTVTDRCLWRVVHRKIREKNSLRTSNIDLIRDWNSQIPSPEHNLRLIPPSPFSQTDEDYLLSLFKAGSQADLARLQGTSRAAVTQRIRRIRSRLDDMQEQQQDNAKGWLKHLAWQSTTGGLT